MQVNEIKNINITPQSAGTSASVQHSPAAQTESVAVSGSTSDLMSQLIDDLDASNSRPASAIVNQALKEAGLPATPDNIRVVNALIENNMPINRLSIRGTVSDARNYPQVPLEALLQMSKADIPINSESISGVRDFLDNTLILSNDINQLADLVENLLNDSSVSEETSALIRDAVFEAINAGNTASGLVSGAVSAEVASASATGLTGLANAAAAIEAESLPYRVVVEATPTALPDEAATESGGEAVTGDAGADTSGANTNISENTTGTDAEGLPTSDSGIGSDASASTTDSATDSGASATTSGSATASGASATTAGSVSGSDASATAAGSVSGSEAQATAAGSVSGSGAQVTAAGSASGSGTQVTAAGSASGSGTSAVAPGPIAVSDSLASSSAEPAGVASPSAFGQGYDFRDFEELTAGDSQAALREAALREQIRNASPAELKKLLKSSLSLSPEKLSKDSIKAMYQRATTFLNKLEEATKDDKSSAALHAKALNASHDLEFLNQLNRLYPHIELPLKLQNGDAEGGLYVYTNKKGKPVTEGHVSALLHLNMPNLGVLDIHLDLDHSNLGLRFYSDSDSQVLLAKDIKALTSKLESMDYSVLASFSPRSQAQADRLSAQSPEESSDMSASPSRLSFDVHA